MNTDDINSKLLIYQQNVIDTYLYYIKENLSLTRNLLTKQVIEPYHPDHKEILFCARAKHLQIMTFIGVTTEHAIKIILLKRGFILNVKSAGKFKDSFMQELQQKNREIIKHECLCGLYSKATNNIEVSFRKKLENFDVCISLFEKDNNKNYPKYYDSISEYNLNPCPDIDNQKEYLGRKTIKPETTLRVIQDMRNSYLHLAEAREEQQGIVWYLFNFIVWLCKKEYPEFFVKEEFIGNDETKKLFSFA